MDDDEVWSFLTATPARPAVAATTHRDGRPHAVPVWYAVDGRTIVFTTGRDTVKGRNLRRDPRVALTVQDDRPPFSFASVEGRAELSDDLSEVRRWATVLGGRYMGEARAREFGDRNGVPGELLVRVAPRRITAYKDVSQ